MVQGKTVCGGENDGAKALGNPPPPLRSAGVQDSSQEKDSQGNSGNADHPMPGPYRPSGVAAVVNPVMDVLGVWLEEECERTFDQELGALLRSGGWVFSTPEIFMMGRPVLRCAPVESILNPNVRFWNYDTWMVHGAAGNLRRFFDYEPVPLPWIAFQRRNVLRFWPRERIRSLCAKSTWATNSILVPG